ncbi:MAG: hypothetical protein IT373_08460 [Polyangiaceae bacterium]|nr:hypothetical protein [Polyangiaceae bacterium]
MRYRAWFLLAAAVTACKGESATTTTTTSAAPSAAAVDPAAAASAQAKKQQEELDKAEAPARALFEKYRAGWIDCDKDRNAALERMRADPKDNGGMMASRVCLEKWWAEIEVQATKQGIKREVWEKHFSKWNDEQAKKPEAERWKAPPAPVASAAASASAAPAASSAPASGSAAPGASAPSSGAGLAGLDTKAAEQRAATIGWKVTNPDVKEDNYSSAPRKVWAIQWNLAGPDDASGWATRLDFTKVAASTLLGPKRVLFVTGDDAGKCEAIAKELDGGKCDEYAGCVAALPKLGFNQVDASMKPDTPLMGMASGLIQAFREDALYAFHFEELGRADKDEFAAVKVSGSNVLVVTVESNAGDAQKVVKALAAE